MFHHHHGPYDSNATSKDTQVPVIKQSLVLSNLILSTMPLPSYQMNYLILI